METPAAGDGGGGGDQNAASTPVATNGPIPNANKQQQKDHRSSAVAASMAKKKKNSDMMDIMAAAQAAAAEIDAAGAAGAPSADHTLGANAPDSVVHPLKKGLKDLVAAAKTQQQQQQLQESSAIGSGAPVPTAAAAARAGAPPLAPSSILHRNHSDEASLVSAASAAAKNKGAGHGRKISWGGTLDVLNAEKKKTSIRLADLNAAHPLEHEAETHIVQTIEDLAAKDASRGEKVPEILQHLPAGAEGVFLDATQQQKSATARNRKNSVASSIGGGGGGANQSILSGGGRSGDALSVRSNRSHQSPRPQHQAAAARAAGRVPPRTANVTVEQDLFNLTNALEALNQPQALNLPPGLGGNTAAAAAAAAHLPSVPETSLDAPQKATGSADLLVANAAVLFRRKKAKQVAVDADGHVVTESQATGGIPGSIRIEDIATAGSGGGGGEAGGGTDAAATAVGPTAKARWGKLRAAALTVGDVNAAALHKKTDSADEGPAAASSGTGSAALTSSNVYNGPVDLDELDDLEIGIATTPTFEETPANSDSTNNNNGGGKVDPALTKSSKKKPMLHFLQGRKVPVKEFDNPEGRYSVFGYLLIMLILTVVACILFYWGGNPPTGQITFVKDANGTIISQDPVIIDPTQPSHSWWLLFAVRLMLTFALTLVSEWFMIDVFCLRWRWINVFHSPLLTLLFVQSRGWPFRATTWSIYNLLMLSGPDPFACHWLYYQDLLRVFNDSNPCGDITNRRIYVQILFLMLTVGLVTSVKRVWIGYLQGKRVFAEYGEEVASLMRKVLLISQVGMLARDIEVKYLLAHRDNEETHRKEDGIWDKVEEFVQNECVDDNSGTGDGNEGVLEPGNRDNLTGSFSQSAQMKIIELLGDWEDPEGESGGEIERNISVASILQFRQSLAFFDARDMFGVYFGHTYTRAQCIESAEEVYGRLLLRSSSEDTLSFHVLAMLALNSDGTLKQDKIRDLITIFRPDRDGYLSALDFVKSVDDVYKKMKLLNATIKKSMRLDQAVEKIFNVAFYIVVGAVGLAVVGIDPWALFGSISVVLASVAFMIGAAASKYVEGLLFILVRKPYGVGDRVFCNAPDAETSMNGSAGWFVRDITLYHTTFVFGTTNEYATISNGALANLRVINAARSPKASLYVFLKFGTNVPWSKIQIFEASLRAFVKSRPREWLGLNGFRTTRVETDMGFHEMIVVLQHRESWQNVGALLVSKAEVTAFCHELQKKMDMKYKSPPMPVELSMAPSSAMPFPVANDKDIGQPIVAKLGGLGRGLEETSVSSGDYDAVAKLFGRENDDGDGD